MKVKSILALLLAALVVVGCSESSPPAPKGDQSGQEKRTGDPSSGNQMGGPTQAQVD